MPHQCYCAAEQGHVEVIKAVVEVLQSSAAQIAGGESTGELKEPSITLFTWGRFVKDVMNARTLSGKTPLMLASENGCAVQLANPELAQYLVSCLQHASH